MPHFHRTTYELGGTWFEVTWFQFGNRIFRQRTRVL